jgi:hypothetical protein
MKKAKRRSRESEVVSQAKRLAFGRPGVTGVDFGVLYRNGKRRGKALGIRFHVEDKRSLNELAPGDILPTELGSLPCDVVKASYQPHSAHPTDVVDPMQPGVSVGNLLRQSTGSLGAIVTDLKTGGPCLLSNWHVLCGSTAAAVGDAIIQPGPRHLNILQPRPVARLLRWTDLAHGIDAAIAALDPAIAVDKIPLGLATVIAGIEEPKVGMRVVKSGTITGVTHAVVDGINGSYTMNYAPFGDTKRAMDAIHLVVDSAAAQEEISLGGDSGAIWVNAQTGAAVALHLGGEDGLGPLAEYALAHPISRVADLLQISLP